nr:PIH1 domain-containing protein 2 isoform X1 [Manis javanica]
MIWPKVTPRAIGSSSSSSWPRAAGSRPSQNRSSVYKPGSWCAHPVPGWGGLRDGPGPNGVTYRSYFDTRKLEGNCHSIWKMKLWKIMLRSKNGNSYLAYFRDQKKTKRKSTFYQSVSVEKDPSSPVNQSSSTYVYTVIDVAYNPGVLQAAGKDQGKKDQLIRMAMQCIEEQLQYTLSYSYHITKSRIKGSIQRMKHNLMGNQADATDLRGKMRKELTLEQIRSSTVSNPHHFPQLLLPKDQVSSKAGCLIEEISSKDIQAEMKKPAHELKIVVDQNEKPLKIELKVELPGVNSVSLCDLSVSEDDLLIEVSEKYRLHLNLPESVDTEMTTAKFIKEKATLIVTMPLA